MEKRFRTMLAKSHGAHFLGWVTYSSYARHSPNPLMYLESRLRVEDIPCSPHRVDVGPLRLAFSGRFLPIKGAVDAMEVAAGIHRASKLKSLDVFGGGPLESAMRKVAPPGTKFHGSVPFTASWIPFVRDHVDVMILPHVQDDPAGTYLEAIGLGVPVAG